MKLIRVIYHRQSYRKESSMSLKGIDVSACQGTINWTDVKLAGINFAILKVIRKDLNKDKQFEANWSGAKSVNMTIQGVYNYSYATTVAKARNDAQKVLEILNGRKTFVWLDVEDNCQKGLGARLIDIIHTYCDVIQSAGLQFGVYTGKSFYNSYIKPYGKLNCPLWIAAYGKNTGDMDLKYQPQIDDMIGWQYTSKGCVSGINGNVDMNVWYKELEALETIIASHNNPYSEPTRTLYKKIPCMRGDDVKWLQTELIYHGFMSKLNAKGKSNVDGVLGNITHIGIGAFQKSVGITVDYKCGKVTREYLKK